jgi:hypothetical protein
MKLYRRNDGQEQSREEDTNEDQVGYIPKRATFKNRPKKAKGMKMLIFVSVPVTGKGWSSF